MPHMGPVFESQHQLLARYLVPWLVCYPVILVLFLSGIAALALNSNLMIHCLFLALGIPQYPAPSAFDIYHVLEHDILYK